MASVQMESTCSVQVAKNKYNEFVLCFIIRYVASLLVTQIDLICTSRGMTNFLPMNLKPVC